MKRGTAPLHVSIFALLLLFSVAGQTVENHSLPLRQSIPWNAAYSPYPPGAVSQSTEKPMVHSTSPVGNLANQEQKTRDLSGEVLAVKNDTLVFKSEETILSLHMPSNAFIWRNGFEATKAKLYKSDYVIITTAGDQAVRISAVSKPIVSITKTALAASLISIGFFIGLFLLRKMHNVFLGVPHGQRLRKGLAA